MVKTAGIVLSLMFLVAMLPAFAQISEKSTGAAFEKGMNPVIGILKGATNVVWKLMQFFIGKDDVSIAYFSYNLGFRDNEVYIEDMTYQNPTDLTVMDLKGNCSVGSLTIDKTDRHIMANCGDVRDANLTDGTAQLISTEIGDYNEDGTPGQIDDIFRYIHKHLGRDIVVDDGAKGQIILFAILIPSLILFFIVADFFMSTGMLRTITAYLISGGITLIALRSGVFTGLLNMISSIFGANGFFLSLLGIYLLFAILIWFYGGIRKSWMLSSEDAAKQVSDAVVEGFTYDLRRGLMGKKVADQLLMQRDKDKKK